MRERVGQRQRNRAVGTASRSAEHVVSLRLWKKEFEAKNGRSATKADIALADPEMMKIAMRLGEI